MRDDPRGEDRSVVAPGAPPPPSQRPGPVRGVREEAAAGTIRDVLPGVRGETFKAPAFAARGTLAERRQDPENAMVAGVWGFRDGHVPAVHARGWRELVPTDSEAIMMTAQHPVPVRESLPLPERFRALPMVTRLRIAGLATLETIERHRPLYHRSLLGGRLLETEGTTIMITALDDQGGIIAVPWSYGERFALPMRRLVERRRCGHPAWTPRVITLANFYLPVWQAVVSVVPQANPLTNIMGSGGPCPTVIAVGRESVNFTSEHRVFTPAHGARFSAAWFEFLLRLLPSLF